MSDEIKIHSTIEPNKYVNLKLSELTIKKFDNDIFTYIDNIYLFELEEDLNNKSVFSRYGVSFIDELLYHRSCYSEQEDLIFQTITKVCDILSSNINDMVLVNIHNSIVSKYIISEFQKINETVDYIEFDGSHQFSISDILKFININNICNRDIKNFKELNDIELKLLFAEMKTHMYGIYKYMCKTYNKTVIIIDNGENFETISEHLKNIHDIYLPKKIILLSMYKRNINLNECNTSDIKFKKIRRNNVSHK